MQTTVTAADESAKVMSGAEIVIEALHAEGVKHVFGYPGGAVLPVYDEIYKQKYFRHILVRHEQAALHAADAYARSTGEVGVALLTSGPGATNGVTGIATAYADSVPLVVFTGQVATSLIGTDAFQECDTVGITRPCVKHNYLVKDVRDLARTIKEAFYIARSGRPGPVLIDLPKDVQVNKCPFVWPLKIDIPSYRPVLKGHPGQIRRALQVLLTAKRPLIYAGGGVIASEASAELKTLAELTDAPVSCSLMGQGAYDETDRRYIGMLGMHGTVKAAYALNNCDLFIGIGTRFSDRVTGDTSVFGKQAKIIHIDIDPAEFNKNIDVDVTVSGDVKAVLSALNAKIAQQSHPEWCEEVLGGDFGEPVQEGTKELPVTPEAVIEELDRLTSGEAIITTEVGQTQMWAAQYYKCRNPRSFISSGGLGTMGYGLGAALGAKTGNPDKTVVNMAGDGSFAMNLNELISAAAHGINIIEIVMNNNVLGMVRQWQRLFYSKHFSETTLDARHIDYVKLGEAFGVKTFVIEKTEDITPVLTEALCISKSAPVMIEVRIDRDINVLPMIPAGKPVVNPITSIDLEA